jgi:hypothetical protein
MSSSSFLFSHVRVACSFTQRFSHPLTLYACKACHAHRHCRLLLSTEKIAPGPRARLSLSPLRSLSALRCAATAHSGTHNHNHNHHNHNLYDHHFLS